MDNRFPKDTDAAREWKIKLGLNVETALHGTICIRHFTNDDFEIINRTNGKYCLKKHAVPIALRNNIQILDDMEDIAPNTNELSIRSEKLNICCESCKTKITETEQILKTMRSEHTQLKNQFNNQRLIMQKRIDDLRKKVKSLQDRSYSLEKTNLNLKSSLSNMEIKKVDPKIEHLSKVCAQ